MSATCYDAFVVHPGAFDPRLDRETTAAMEGAEEVAATIAALSGRSLGSRYERGGRAAIRTSAAIDDERIATRARR
jgi:hypothetical protein